MKTSGVRPIAETPPQTMTELGFCTLWTNLCSSRMAEAEVDNILSFWRFEASSTVNNFSSENKTFSSPWLANRVNSPLLLDSLFARILSVRKWTRFLLKEDSPKSLFTILLRDPRDIFSSSAIFLTDLRGFRQTRLLTALFISLVVAVTGRPERGLSDKLPVSRKRFIVLYTKFLRFIGILRAFKICAVVFPLRNNSIMAALSVSIKKFQKV